MSRPTLKKSYTLRWLPLIEATEELMEHMDSEDYNVDRECKYIDVIFESVMTELYGKDMWEWYREKQG